MTADSQQFTDLAAKWLAGTATGAETTQLLAACRADATLLAALAEYVEVERLLPLLAEPGDVFADELRDRLQALPDSDQFAQRVRTRIGDHRRRAALPLALILAAAAALAFAFWWPESPEAIPPESVSVVQPTTEPLSLATVATSVATAWEQGFAPRGDVFPAGRFHLLRGLASLQFASGVEVIVEGPAEFNLVDAERMVLIHGNVTANVPDGAEGFTIDTNSTRVIDRGTEFAVSASRTGDTEVHVLDGIVDTHPLNNPGGMLRLSENQARIFDHGGIGTIAVADPSRFYRRLPGPTAELKWLHWGFNEARGDQAIADDHGLANRDVVASFATIEDGETGPQWIDGPFGAAIAFDGHDDYLQTDYEGIGGTDARTVAFWVRLPTDWQSVNGYGMVSWGSYEYDGATWQVSANPMAKEGPVGRLRVGINKGQVIGETDLRDGRWHHVAVVMYGGGDANTATHVILYLDGELERASRKSVLNIDTDVESETARQVLIGRNASLQLGSHRCFRGAIDEVYLINAALDEHQIRGLMGNRPPR